MIESYLQKIPLWQSLAKKHLDPELEIIEMMRHIEIFRELKPRELKLVRSECYIRNHTEGEHIFRDGEPGVGIYIILEGQVQIYRETKGTRRIYQILSRGDSFGELGLLEDNNRPASALAVGKTQLLGFFRPGLETFIKRKPQIASRIMFNLAKSLGKKLINTNLTLEEITWKLNECEEHLNNQPATSGKKARSAK